MKKSLVALSALLALAVVPACSGVKPIFKTINDLAYDLCVAENAKNAVGLSADDVGKAFCSTETALKPFLDAILSAKAGLHAPKASSSVVVIPPPPPACPSVVSVIVAPAPSASVAQKLTAPKTAPSAAPSAAPKAAKK